MKSVTLLVLSALAVAACDNKPTEGKAQAQVSEPVKTAASGAASAAAPAGAVEKLAITPENSKVGFVGAKVTGKHEGKFEKLSGTLDLDPAKPENSKVKVDIDLASVKTDQERLDQHLVSPDFFNTAEFAKATFESTSIVAEKGEKGETHKITGNLDFHGVKKSISFPATISVAADKVTAKAEFGVNRMDFGVKYPGKADDAIKEDVLIKLDLELPRTKK